MKIQLLIAICESDYGEHLSRVLAERNADIFEVSSCSKPELFEQILSKRGFDVALLDEEMADQADLSGIRLPILIWDGAAIPGERIQKLPRICKFQRISSIASDVALQYSTRCGGKKDFAAGRGNITAVWSPVGGVGKTTVALAFAAQKAAKEKRAVYLSLEPFSASPVYFKAQGKSISTVLEKLDTDVALLVHSMRQEDSGSGILYFDRPQNYDDINILMEEDIRKLLEGCAANTDELVVDLGSVYNSQVRQVLAMSDKVLLVSDSSVVGRAKCDQFRTQHDVYANISDKLVLVANRGARNAANQGEEVLNLPKVDSDDPVVVYRTLSAYMG